MSIQTVSIVGVGLIGGSFGLALKKRGFTGRIIGVSSPATIKKALARGAIDESAALKDAAAQSDLVFLSTPVPQIIEDLPRIAAVAKDGALVTDAGSAKAAIVDTASQVFHRKAVFIGGHPMAGKEGRGVEIADADLFVNSVWALTPADPALLELPAAVEFTQLIAKIGARQKVMGPSEHDRVVAWTSHLPQLLSTALARSVGDQVDETSLEVAGGGLRDMTRLAESPYEIWEGIIAANGGEIRRALDVFIDELDSVRSALGTPEMEDAFRQAGEAARKIRKGRQ
ncbi:MAG: prephenate dehydrogenase/arogenate dehydrogenase family protein [Acidobacteria bacterium]|nr:prephenate dehydrogenase/arogenate dehydrogenase family protein [Acidobacteriota bacterium]MDA1233475.1 prephenate dehydrogenase/arogenate dehydrogenase family protein [Acidobacteriota bacterium]